MNSECCCDNSMNDSRRVRNVRLFGFGGSILPGAGLLLIPKCPACLAGYVAVSTGVGISLPVATYLRTVILVICIASLICFALISAGGFLNDSALEKVHGLRRRASRLRPGIFR